MIDSWFKKDIKKIYENHSVAVFIDESGNAKFLLETVKNDFSIHIVNEELDELHVKYLIEKDSELNRKHLIYTNNSRDKLKFIREYCETNGCLEIHYLHNYIKDKLHQTENLNINLPEDELIVAAKISVCKDRNYWIDIVYKGSGEIFDLKKELLPFLHDPVVFSKEKYDSQIRDNFYRKVNELLGQDFVSKPPETLAKEVVKCMLDGLVTGECGPTLEEIYKNWLESVTYKTSCEKYLNSYKIPDDVDIWSINIAHPFRTIDEKCLQEIGKNLADKDKLQKYKKFISNRAENVQAKSLGITFWYDVETLMDFDVKNICYLSSFEECIEFYTKHFYQLDTAIRNLYSEFLNKKKLLYPFQEYYKNLVSIFMDRWFKYFDEYKETQSGLLQKIIGENSNKTAVIVGDGITYELACLISEKVDKSSDLTKKVIISDIPSETENNMSAIYRGDGAVEKIHNNREKYLLEQNPDVSIEFIELETLTDEPRAAQYLICTYKDIDDIGEKLQHKALKYFHESIGFFAEKINQLLGNGYLKVYLISDHGFVLSGILSESDKISVDLEGLFKKSERFIRTEKQQASLIEQFIEVKKKYKNFNYLYFSKNMNPFKTPGVYGFSHGGLSPQELVTPYFCWEVSLDSTQTLSINVMNKSDLKNVTGELFQIKIEAGKVGDALAALDRKIYMVFFSNKKQVNKSEVVSIKAGKEIIKEYTFDGNEEIEVHVLDAQTKEKLDSVIIKRNNARDLGGLL